MLSTLSGNIQKKLNWEKKTKSYYHKQKKNVTEIQSSFHIPLTKLCPTMLEMMQYLCF